MILEKEELLDKVFKSVVMNIMTVKKSILSEEAWLDVGGHYYCVDGVRDILLERESESLQYFLSDDSNHKMLCRDLWEHWYWAWFRTCRIWWIYEVKS